VLKWVYILFPCAVEIRNGIQTFKTHVRIMDKFLSALDKVTNRIPLSFRTSYMLASPYIIFGI
jgi:hypothetical protein